MYIKSGEGEKENLVKASKKILCSQEKVLVLISDSLKNLVHRRWIQSYFRFHENLPPKMLCSGYGVQVCEQCSVLCTICRLQ